VVVHALAAERELGANLGGRRGGLQPLEEAAAYRRERDPQAIGLVEQGDGRVEHGGTVE
jgi:hypothetical protein